MDRAVAKPVRRARVAVAALFLTNGALFANLLPRFPEIKAMLGLDNAGFGLAAAAFPLGAMLAGLAAGALIRRFGSARVAVAGTVLTALALACAGMAPTGLLFAAGLGVAGAMDAITDVGQNSHGLRVQKLFGRSILNSFHAVWSMGAVLGGLMGAAAAGLGIPVQLHLAVSGALFAAVSLASLRFLLPGAGEESAEPAPAEETSDGARPAQASGTASRFGGRGKYLVLLALVLVAAAGSLVEDAGNTWAALYLKEGFAAPASIAGLGFVALVGAQFVGRLVGDRLVDRFGQRLVAQAGGAFVALGMGTALLFPSLPGSLAGFAAAGFGIATLVPAAMHGADNIEGLRPGTGLTVLSWLMRISFLLSPPVVGAIADATSLRAGLWVVPLAGVMVLLLSPVLAGKKAR
ncbi:MFS transporter [Arthrobacter sp. HY1533]|uniref:MFS transporter n=1 Tax=Arthrobacter sp. HY1533 TaxID=2970919 RepID=UPI0022B9DDE0|nr:MFS transporter [Arthrobacter sp. HY1533]